MNAVSKINARGPEQGFYQDTFNLDQEAKWQPGKQERLQENPLESKCMQWLGHEKRPQKAVQDLTSCSKNKRSVSTIQAQMQSQYCGKLAVAESCI